VDFEPSKGLLFIAYYLVESLFFFYLTARGLYLMNFVNAGEKDIGEVLRAVKSILTEK
jgi:hypothetical protein